MHRIGTGWFIDSKYFFWLEKFIPEYTDYRNMVSIAQEEIYQ